MTNTYITLINLLENIITILIFAHIILSYVMSPFHPIRQAIDKIVSPMLEPINRIMPPMGGLNLSPMVLLLLVYFISRILRELVINL